MSEAPKEEAQVQDSQVFNMAAPGEEEDLRDAWGRPADADEVVDMTESQYSGKAWTVDRLKEELRSREAEGREFDKGSIKTKRDLAAALDADDKAQAAEAEAKE